MGPADPSVLTRVLNEHNRSISQLEINDEINNNVLHGV